MNEQRADSGVQEFTIETGRLAAAYQTFRRWPFIPVAVVISLVVVAIFAELVAPHHPLEGDLDDRNVAPAWSEEGTSEFLLGTDHIGRGILSRMIFGARVSLIVAVTVLIAGAALERSSGWWRAIWAASSTRY